MSRTVLSVAAILVAVHASSLRAEIPEKWRSEIDRAKFALDEGTTVATKKLLDRFEPEIEEVRGRTGMKADAKQALIAVMRAEREAFERDGAFPWSAPMRTHVLAYLKSVREAGAPARKAYDKAIAALVKAKDDAAAEEVAAERKKVLAPKVVGAWNCGGVNFRGGFTYTLHSDGSVTKGPADGPVDKGSTWAFEKANLIVTVRKPGGPPEGFIDTCVLDDAGEKLKAKNQFGGAYEGTRAEPKQRKP